MSDPVEVEYCPSTLRDFLRDMHVAVLALTSDSFDAAALQRYMETVCLIHELTVGDKLTARQAKRIFRPVITQEELIQLYGT